MAQDKNKILLLGSSGSLGKALYKVICDNDNFVVYAPTSKELDFSNKKSKDKLFNILKKQNCDAIINCIGKFADNSSDYNYIFDPNLKSNWEILQYFLKNKQKKMVKIILIGSSAYSGPRKNYMLYAASKAALNSLYKSAKEKFQESKISIYIDNPKPFHSNITGNLNLNKNKIDTSIIANRIYRKLIN